MNNTMLHMKLNSAVSIFAVAAACCFRRLPPTFQCFSWNMFLTGLYR